MQVENLSPEIYKLQQSRSLETSTPITVRDFCKSRRGTQQGPDYQLNWTIYLSGYLSGYLAIWLCMWQYDDWSAQFMCWSLIGQSKCILQTSAGAMLLPGSCTVQCKQLNKK